MARLTAATCPKCGAEVELDADSRIVRCTYCQTSSFVRTDEYPETARERSEHDAVSVAARAELERDDEGVPAPEHENEAQLAAWRREDELRLQAAVREAQDSERIRRIVILVLAALPIGAFLALYLTK